MSNNALWYKDAVFYQINVRAFADGNGDGHGDFVGLLNKVDYLAELGVDAVWLMPFYPSPLRDDGYDVSDYCDIASPYGTLEDFKAVLDKLHEYNIRVVIDLVINHTSDQHPWFIESRSSKDNPKRDWYVWSGTEERYRGTRIIFLDTEDSNWTFDPTTGEYYWHRFYKEQPDLNYDNPEVQEEMLNVLRFWLELGVDGFRVDAVPYLYEREGTTCENLEETHEYLKRMRAMVDTDYPGRVLLAEANQWPVDLLPYLENNDEFHMAFNFPIMPRLYMGLRRQNRQDIVDILNQTPPIPYDTQWCIFLRNHDELTLEMVTVEQREWMWNEYAPEPRMRINLGIRRRLAPLLDNDVRKINLLNALLFSLPGTPIVYYGDEIGMGDNIWLDDRNGVRTPMQWNGSFNGGFSEAEGTYLPVIDDPIYGYRTVNVERQRDTEDSLWHSVCRQINLRREHTVFGRGDFRTLEPNNPSIFAFIRWLTERENPEEVSGVDQVIVLANLSDEPQDVDIDATDYLGKTPVDLLTGNPYKTIETERYTFGLNPYGCLWLALK